MLTSALAEENNPHQIFAQDIVNNQSGQQTNIAVIEPPAPILTLYALSDKRKRELYQGITLASVLFNPLFAIFLYMAISSAVDESRSELNLEDKFWEIFFVLLNVSISSLSGISDVIVVNPIEETEELLKALGENQLTERLNNLSICERRAIKSFNFFNQVVGNSVFLVGSASAALSLTYVSSSTGLRLGLGVPVTVLSHIYLNMLSRAKIDEHSYQLLHRLLDKRESMLIKAFKTPLQSLEVLIQVLVNALNRGITYGYIMNQVLKAYIDENNTSQNVVTSLISYATASSFYTFLVSRTLNVHKQFFNPQFAELPAELLKNTRVSFLGNLVDVIMTLLRAGAASTLLFRHGPKNIPVNIFLTTLLGLFLTVHGLYVRHKNRLYQTALNVKLKQSINELRIGEQQAENTLTPEKMFDLIKEQFKVRNSIRISATIINAGSRLADWFSFLGFLTTLNRLIGTNNDSSFDFYDLLCIQQLLCNPALENALSFFQEGIVDTLAYYRTKIYLERNERHFGWHCIVKSKVEYPKNYLKKFLPIQERDIELPQILPLQPANPEEQAIENNDAMDAREQKNPFLDPDDRKTPDRPLTPLFELQKMKTKGESPQRKLSFNNKL